MNKVCVTCHQELPIELFREITVKGMTKHQGRCKPCGRAYQRAYYEQHKDRIKLQVKEWHQQRPDYIKDWMKNNPEKVKLHKENHRPKRLQYSRERYWADPETAKQKSKEYRDANPELMRERKQKWIQSSREHLRSYYNGLTKNLSDSYIRGKLARKSKRKEILSAKDIPQELVELKRFEILIKRELKKCNTSAN